MKAGGAFTVRQPAMLYGMYLSSHGAHLQGARLDAIANNIANANTATFKRDFVVAQSHKPFDAALGNNANIAENVRNMTGGVSPVGTFTNFDQGPLQPTGNPLDVAVSGPGFFEVVDGRTELLTRDGQFAVSDNGTLVTRDRELPVLGTGGQAITGLDPVQPVKISDSGVVLQKGIPVGQLGLVEPTLPDRLVKRGGNLYQSTVKVESAPATTTLRSGHIELSAVNPVNEMMAMIETTRSFEANMNMIKYQDESFARLLQSVSRR